MADEETKKRLEMIHDWGQFDNMVKQNTVVNTGGQAKPFRQLFMSDELTNSIESFCKYWHKKAETNGGEIKVKRQLINDMLDKFKPALEEIGQKTPYIPKGYVAKTKDKDGKIKPEDRIKSLPNQHAVGQLRATQRQFFSKDTWTNCTSQDYLRVAVNTGD